MVSGSLLSLYCILELGLVDSRVDDRFSVDSTTVEAKRRELVGYDGYKHRKGSKIHMAVTAESLH
jgi:hypothetical protein